jgi:hypothetical protein
MLGPQFPIKSKLGNVGFAIVQKENR